MNVQSGPPVLADESVADRYVCRLPKFLVIGLCISGALFASGVAAAAIRIIRTRF